MNTRQIPFVCTSLWGKHEFTAKNVDQVEDLGKELVHVLPWGLKGFSSRQEKMCYFDEK